VPIPASQDPFVNTPLIRVGLDQRGVERFWTSTWNSASGTTGLLVSPDGEHRVYRFGPPHFGFYSAVAEDAETLWLCGDLARVVRLDLVTGEFEAYDTGAPSALVFQGMAWDAPTGKLFAAAFPVPDRVGFSFDTRRRETARLYPAIAEEHYLCTSFAHPDGTHTVVMYNPGVALLHWDPRTDELVAGQLRDLVPTLPQPYDDKIGRPVTNESGAVRLAGCWYNPGTQVVVDGPEPERELSWFGRQGRAIWGVSGADANARVGVWDLDTGRVSDLVQVPDTTVDGVALTDGGDILTVSLYGLVRCFDGRTGDLRLEVQTATSAVGHVDCLRRIDDRRVLGTPFITQRFWEVDLVTGQGVDQGRATSGVGEVLQTWLLNGVVYQTSYTRGELTAYEPDRPVEFGVNPRVLTRPPTGMRPIAATDDGRRLFYSCSHHYGHLGCILTRYDTVTGEALHRDDPLPDQAVSSLVRDPRTGVIVAGTTVDADCHSAEPRAAAAVVAVIDPESLDPLQIAQAPAGVTTITVVGAYDDAHAVCVAAPPGSTDPRWFLVRWDAPVVPPHEEWQSMPAAATRLVATARPGVVVVPATGRQELWDLRGPRLLAVLAEEPDAYLLHVEGDDLLMATPSELVVLDGVLAGDR